MSIRILGECIAVLAFQVAAAAQSAHVDASARACDLYVLAGQSNAEGLGPRDELPARLTGPFADVSIWNAFQQEGRWEPLEVGRNHLSSHDSTRAPRVGIESALVEALRGASAGRPIRLVKLAVDGAPLGRVPGMLSWDADAGELHTLLLDRLGDAVAALRAEGLDPELRGVVWYQGETDATGPRLAAGYAALLRRFHARTTKALDELGLQRGAAAPWVVVAIHPRTFGARRGHVGEVRAAQRAFATETADCVLVDTGTLALQKDRTHLTTAALVELGAMVANALARPAPAPAPRRIAPAPVRGG